MHYFIANWKAEKNLNECLSWIKTFSKLAQSYNNSNIQIIICPPIAFLTLIKPHLKPLASSIKFGAQDISQFDNGKYTGETTAQMLKDLVDYVIIGHSERRTHNNETDKSVELKTEKACQYGLEPIVCISAITQTIPKNTKIVAYEPVSAIGTGNNYSVQSVIEFKKNLKLPSETNYLYGGSVNKNNIEDYLQSQEIDGFLIGTASLDPHEFFSLLP